MITNPVPSYIKVARVILAITGTVQEVFQKPPGKTHNVVNQQAIAILNNDGHAREAMFLKHYLDHLDRGVEWADSAWKNSSHFFNPQNSKGFWKWPNAAVEARLHYNSAVKHIRSKNYAKAMFYLGAAVHLVQDLCVPHHSKGILFDGHQEFEDWAEEHCEEYLINENGLYLPSCDPAAYVINNADISQKYYDLVSLSNQNCDYKEAMPVLFELCQRTTAGFLLAFCKVHLSNLNII